MKKSIQIFALQIVLCLAVLFYYPGIPIWKLGVFLMIGVLYMIWESGIFKDKDGYWFGVIPPRGLLSEKQIFVHDFLIGFSLLLLVTWLSKSPIIFVLGLVVFIIGLVRLFNKN